MTITCPLQAEILVYNDSVIALACGTGGSLLGCVLIIGTGRPATRLHCIFPGLRTIQQGRTSVKVQGPSRWLSAQTAAMCAHLAGARPSWTAAAATTSVRLPACLP